MNYSQIKSQALKQAGGNASDKKVPVTFAYEGQSCFSINGECTVKMTEDELALFKRLTQEANECGLEVECYDVLTHCEVDMPVSLYQAISSAIHHDIVRQDARIAAFQKQLDRFNISSEEEFESMTMEERIERYVEDEKDGLNEYVILRINIIEPLSPMHCFR